MKIEDLSIEEIYQKANIQSNLIDLQSKNKDRINSALNTLASITKNTNRRDALYALYGYYAIEAKSMDEIEFFFRATMYSYSFELYKLILIDLSKNKNVYRQKKFIHDFLYTFSAIIINCNETEINEVKAIIQNSVWGEKLKNKFFIKIEIEEF